MRPKVGIPRALGYYYMYPFYKTFLEELGAEVIVSPPTTKSTLDMMDVCPTDEPCVGVKLYFAHVQTVADIGVDFVWSPNLICMSKGSFCCPKFMGITDMVRNGLHLHESKLLAPRFDNQLSASDMKKTFLGAAAKLGITDKAKVYQALWSAYNAQASAERSMVTNGLTIAQVYERLGRPKPQRNIEIDSFLTAFSDTMPRIGVIGHPYLIYDMLCHDLVARLGEFGRVVTAEMISREDINAGMQHIFEGDRLWHFEARLLGAAIHLLRNHLVERLILVGSFECGPESIIESYIEDEAERAGIPLLVLTIDEQTGEAGLVTRMEAFLDTCAPRREHKPDIKTENISTTGEEKGDYRSAPSWFPSPGSSQHKNEMVVGCPSMGYLDIAIRSILEDTGTRCIANRRTNKQVFELGAELAPEFVCFPLAATLGQMRVLLDQGANTLFMVNGKGRCRLGWYAQVQERLLRRAGYDFKMITLDSPVPLRQNWGPFRDTLKQLTGNASFSRILKSFWFGYNKLQALDQAETVCRKIRAIERERGSIDKLFSKFVPRMEQASDLASVKQGLREFMEASMAIETEDTNPLKVRIVGEMWVVLEHLANQEMEKTLASQDIRVEVDREISASQWFRQNVLNDRSMRSRLHQIEQAAFPYLSEEVGGHGQETVGAAALAKQEGCDGLVHIFPFTCMPEIIAQNIMVRLSEDKDIPILTHIVSEQTGEAGLQTRVEAFLDILEERRKHGTSIKPQIWTMAKSA